MTPSITETQIFTATRAFLLAVLPAGTEVIQGQTNRVPQPIGPDYVVMTSMLRERLSFNVETYTPSLQPAPAAGTKAALQPIKFTMQIDVHGPASADNAQTISTMFRDEYACGSFKTSGIDAQPLYTSEPRQMPFMGSENQYEDRWSIDAVMQVNPTVILPQDFFEEAHVTTEYIVDTNTLITSGVY